MIHILLIAVFAVLFLHDASSGPPPMTLTRAEVAGVVLGGMFLIWLAAHVAVMVLGRRIDRSGSLRAVAMADRVVSLSRFVAVLFHVAAVMALGWLDAVRSLVGDLVLIDEIIAAAPVLLVFVGGWWSMYPIERRLRDAVVLRDLEEGRPPRPMPSRAAFVLYSLRHHGALVIVPVLALGGWGELVNYSATRFTLPAWLPLPAVQILGMLAVLAVIPAVLRHVWDTVRLGPGPLRDMLERMCAAHGVRVRELLVWRTHGTMMNGAVMGLVSPIRYILLTDALLENLEGRQVEAVMAHELAHVRRRHMIWLGVTALAAIGLAGILLELLRISTNAPWARGDWGQAIVTLGAIAAGLLFFGFVSRRFEWQADAFAVQHLSGFQSRRAADNRGIVLTPEAVSAMTSALDMVAYLNHIPRNRFTWRHGSIATRQHKLRSLVGVPANGLKTDRDAHILKLASLLALAAAIGIGMLLERTHGQSAESGRGAAYVGSTR